MDATRPEAALHHLESATFAENYIALVHTNIAEEDVAVAVGSVVVAQHGEHALNGDSRSIGRNSKDGLLLVSVRVVWIGFAHDEEDFGASVTSAAGPPFLVILDEYMV